LVLFPSPLRGLVVEAAAPSPMEPLMTEFVVIGEPEVVLREVRVVVS
jgi:hypothetical protein